MAGFFYAPPPARIGGSQPYAPKLGIVQSGAAPEAPPIRGPLALATLALVVSAWAPQPVRAQSSAKIAPLISTVAPAVPYSRDLQNRIVRDVWNQSVLVVLGGTQVAPLIAETPVVDSPPLTNRANINLLIGSWTSSFLQSQGYAELVAPPVTASTNPSFTQEELVSIVQSWQPLPQPKQYRPFVASLPIVNDPPRSSLVNARTVLQSWVPPFIASQGYSEFAPLAPAAAAVDNPPLPSIVNFQLALASWLPPWMPPQGFSKIASILPLVDAPPQLSKVNQGLLLQSWVPPFIQAQGYAELVIERIDVAPLRTLINFSTIARQWEPRWTGPDQVKFAPNAPPPVIPDNPPRFSYANFNLVLNSWIPPTFKIQSSAQHINEYVAVALPSHRIVFVTREQPFVVVGSYSMKLNV